MISAIFYQGKQGLSAAFEVAAHDWHRGAADKRYSLGGSVSESFDPISDLMRRTAEDGWRAAERERVAEEFKSTNRRLLAEMSELELATWHAKYPSDSPQAKFAEHEWQRRLVVEQVKATRFAAWLSATSALVGVIIGALVTVMIANLSKDVEKVRNDEQAKTSAKAKIESPKLAPEAPASNVVPAKQIPHGKK